MREERAGPRRSCTGCPACRHGDTALGDALGRLLQQCGTAVQAVIVLAECVHVRVGAGIQLLLEGAHVVGHCHAYGLVAATVCEDRPDLGVDEQCKPGVLLGQ
jgi:hypothetical protein